MSFVFVLKFAHNQMNNSVILTGAEIAGAFDVYGRTKSSKSSLSRSFQSKILILFSG